MKDATPSKGIIGFDPRPLYEKGGFNMGEAELIIGGSAKQVLGRMAACLLWVRDHSGIAAFHGVTVIAPPRLVWDLTDEEILEMIIQGYNDLRYEQVSLEERVIVQKLLKIHRCEQLDANDLSRAVKEAGERRLLLIPEASKYRDRKIVATPSVGRTAVVIPEDQWIPHFTSLAADTIKTVKENTSFLVFSVDETPPARESNMQTLEKVDALYIAHIKHADEIDPGNLLVENANRWIAMAVSGRTEQALAEIESKNIAPEYKTQLIIQLASRSGNHSLAAKTIRKYLDDKETFPTEIAARFSRIAFRGGDEDAAKILLDQSIDKVSDQMLLETLLMLCGKMNDVPLFDRVWSRLKALFPSSEELIYSCESRLMQLSQLVLGEHDESSPSRTGFSDFHNYVADTLSCKKVDGYESLMNKVDKSWGEFSALAALCAGLHAQRSKNPLSALLLGVRASEEERYKANAIHLLLASVRHVMLMELMPQEDLKFYKLSLIHILSYLANHPEDTSIRCQLSSALSVESAGLTGIPILASLNLDLFNKVSETAPSQSLPTAVSEEELREFFQNALSWMAKQTVLEPGVTQLPSELAGNNPAGLIQEINKLLRYSALWQKEDVENLEFLEKCAYLVCLLTPYAPLGAPDLDALRLVAAKHWIQGKSQRARDLAEQIIELGSDTLERKRIAWCCYADIYHRTNSPVNALIGIACAASLNVKIQPSDLFQEKYILLRIVRDLQLYDIARSVLQTCRELYNKQDIVETGLLRLDGIELDIRLAELSRDDLSAIKALLDDAKVHCNKVLSVGDETLPAAAHFSQVAMIYEKEGGELDNENKALLKKLHKTLGTETSSFLHAVSSAVPMADDLTKLHNRLETARNSEDTTGDQVAVVIATRRLLSPHVTELQQSEAALGLELLAERGIQLPKQVDQLRAEWPSEYIIQLSLEGLAVLMLGLDEQGELLAVIAENGNIEVKRPGKKSKSFQKRLNLWSTSYPYRFGLIEREEGNGEFYKTMQEFDIPIPSSQQILVIAEPALQQLPLNILLDTDIFTGESKAIGLAPSLTWLKAMQYQPSIQNEQRVAWISTSNDDEAFGTLEMIFARLQPIFNKYGFAVNNSGHIPKELQKAQIAIVTAHGQLTNETRYIHRITDEQAFAESPNTLARALAGVELVILFICSGGRIDKHPLANTTVSLPKMLLDRGCRVVIASPWPLDSAVTGNWLEGFMDAWESGSTVLDANFKANQYVNKKLGPEPQYALAMSVYGDIQLRKTENRLE